MYGPVRTVVWQGSAGDRGPYADQFHVLGRGLDENALGGVVADAGFRERERARDDTNPRGRQLMLFGWGGYRSSRSVWETTARAIAIPVALCPWGLAIRHG